MALSEAREYLSEAREAGAVEVCFFGGEPLYHFDLLTGGVEHARKVGLSPITMSNAFWATSEELALKRLRLLRERGLDSIWFSADPFHLEYVPLEHIRNAVKAAKSLDLLAEVNNCYFVEEDGDDVLRRCREIASRLLPHEANVDNVGFCGTAAEILAERAPKQSWAKYRTCRMGGIELALVAPSGHVQIDPCWRISIGNAKERKLSEIITTYDRNAHPIFEILNEEGVLGLTRMAMRYGFEPTEYASACHLCYEARKVLLNHYPEHLAPAIWYERAK